MSEFSPVITLNVVRDWDVGVFAFEKLQGVVAHDFGEFELLTCLVLRIEVQRYFPIRYVLVNTHFL